MKIKKIPMRTCIVTKEKLPKQELIRVVRTPEGNIVIDETGKANGRGAYLKKDVEVFEKARKSKILNRQLEVDVPDTLSSRSALLIVISMFDIALGIGIINYVKKNKVTE